MTPVTLMPPACAALTVSTVWLMVPRPEWATTARGKPSQRTRSRTRKCVPTMGTYSPRPLPHHKT